MNTLNPDTRAVVTAAENLTTQIRRIADTLTTPVAVGEMDTIGTCDASSADGLSTGMFGPCILRHQHDGPVHQDKTGARWATNASSSDDAPAPPRRCPLCRIAVPLVTPEQAVQHFFRRHPEQWLRGPGPWPRLALSTQMTPADAKTSLPFPRASEDIADEQPLREQLQADEDQALRWARRESLLVLLTRLQRGRALTEDEAGTLRQHVESEMSEADTARSVAAGNKRHVQVMYAELERAQAATERVRALADQWDNALAPAKSQYSGPVRAALDGTEQPTTKEA